MNIVTDLNEWRQLRNKLMGKTIGLVTTMGNLHAGHISLCEKSKHENDITVVTIFINPTQFNNPQDFENYPCSIERDQDLLIKTKVDYLLVPDALDMYADNYEVQVNETNLSHELEGEYRPGHFTGMLTVVLKLLNLVQPARAYFGEKDYQQLLLVKKMVQALFLPVEIVGVPTIRAENGLALSSRNSRLNEQQKEKAVNFAQMLQSNKSVAEVKSELQTQNYKVDYIAEQWGRRLAAVWVDDVRLIDNIKINESETC